ncbi:MAG: helix-turn-helix domain-containing protein [Tannerella sp.]|nr:helix-turn-helix domain-containing protein [Tannerella sp.]
MGLMSASVLSPLLLAGSYRGVTFIVLCVFFGLHIGWIPVVHYLTADAVRKTFVWYVRFTSLLLLPIAFMIARSNDPSSCLYFMVIPLSCYVMLPARKVIGWAVYAFVLMLAAYLPHFIFGDPIFEYLSFDNHTAYHNHLPAQPDNLQPEAILYCKQWYLTLNKLLNLLFVFLHICLTLYYIHRLHEISDMDKSQAAAPVPSAESDVKYNALYRRIVDIMANGEPFCDPTFSVAHLVTATGSNTNYITNAIQRQKGMNVTTFINSYRIEFAKRALQQAGAKYTIKHISQSAGFSHQATFNRVFKIIAGLTPTEYINELRIEN